MYLWREVGTPLCDSLGCYQATVGGDIQNGKLTQKRVLCMDFWKDGDMEMCPILIEHNDRQYIYAAWYQYHPERKSKGIALWIKKDNSIQPGDFQLIDTIPLKTCYTLGKWKFPKIAGKRWYLSKPIYHDIWHFDLFEYHQQLYMVSVTEDGDNIMLSVSKDYRHFKTFGKPLVNNHNNNYSPCFYKPTAFVKNDTLHLFYTAIAQNDSNRNQLFHTQKCMSEIIQMYE